MFGLELEFSALLVVCILCACVFECINGFHDAANAVATVIYTNSMKPWHAVVLSGLLNGVGVFLGGTAVAMGIISMLPVETLVDQDTSHSLGMVGAILLTAIFWNLGTWWLAIPASSSHTLIGSILGVGIAYSLLPGTGDAAVNWKKAGDVALSLICSPAFGFVLALALMALVTRVFAGHVKLFRSPEGDEPPPWWIRGVLIMTCGLVSFSHGSNDGQKGMGLMMLILIGVAPSAFSIDRRYDEHQVAQSVRQVKELYDKSTGEVSDPQILHVLEKASVPLNALTQLTSDVAVKRPQDASPFEIRKSMLLLRSELKALGQVPSDSLPVAVHELRMAADGLSVYTDYVPMWVIVLVAVSLAAGTMVGWERIVITIGEKIGKNHLSYAQGASAEIVAASTIAASTYLGLPVSTTQVLSSGIAGSMYASGGIANLNKGTIRKIVLAWVLTFPICVTMSGTLFLIFRTIFD